MLLKFSVISHHFVFSLLGKVRDPVWSRYDTPHSCGEVCGKKREGLCRHPCNM